MIGFEFYPSFLSSAETHSLTEALKNLPWERGVAGWGHPVPRDEVWIGPYPYTFSGRTLNSIPEPPEIASLRERLAKWGEFNSVLLNRYSNERDSVAWHSDDEPEMSALHGIASISLGGRRDFRIKHVDDPNDTSSLSLVNGSLVVMLPGFQSKYEHCIPKTKKPCSERINLTFRWMLPKGQRHTGG
jgi:alkylated DNA repair dioxygenase AlkB